MNNGTPLFMPAGQREDGCTCPQCGQTVRQGEMTAICTVCGAVHHGSCWGPGDRCASYACAPARIEVPAGRADAWKITPEELNAAVPQPPRRSAAAPAYPTPVTLPPAPVSNRLAIAAFIVAVAGILFFGLLTGLVAILLGVIALSGRHDGKRGLGLSLSAVLLGLLDVVGWVVFLVVMFSHSASAIPVVLEDLQTDPAARKGVSPALDRALCATVMLESNHGGLKGKVIGSGVVLKLDNGTALLVTNRHVIDPNFPGAAELKGLPPVRVRYIEGTIGDGKVVWLAPHGIDLALVQTDTTTPEARTAPWEAGRAVHVGETVFAIGSPHQLGWTHTQGVVSQLRLQHTDGVAVHVIQTQAALNPGNSGGGLFDQEGRLVGINTWINDKRVSEGLGFAIALETLLESHPPGLAGNGPALEKR
jgi:hypothetical protein